MIEVHPNSWEAQQLFIRGMVAFSRAEQQGIRIDMDQLKQNKMFAINKMQTLEKEFKETKFYRDWVKSVNGVVNIYSGDQLADYLYTHKGIEPPKLTEKSGKGSTDKDSLTKLSKKFHDLTFYSERNKWKKLLDTMEGFEIETVNGFMHPFFNLHTVRTFRGCLAKGTKILVARDFETHPNGIPIEDVKVGDYVYCFDNNRNPSLQKVTWSGKTGTMEVIRVHFSAKGHGKGYLDLTPDHRVRLIDGSYVQAKDLLNDFRKTGDSKHFSKSRVLSCFRNYDSLNFTGHLKNGHGVLEHRLIYKKLIGDLSDEEIIHHKDGNHLNHCPSNLEKTTLVEHSRYHGINVSENIKKKRLQVLQENRHKITYHSGEDNSSSLNLSKFSCLRALFTAGGKSTKVQYDFEIFKKYCVSNGIELKKVALRFSKDGSYISKTRLIELSKLGRSKVQKILGHNHYRLLELYRMYNIDENRLWGNQFGAFGVANHEITNIEYLGHVVDVYDLTVDKYNNFIANEICVHNSSNDPNFQNIPIRDEEIGPLCRNVIVPRLGHRILEADFKAIEVGISACYNKDTNLLKYVRDFSTDMHRDMAQQIFIIDKFDKKIQAHSHLRKAAKNGFVFPQFYGDYYKNNAIHLAEKWCGLPEGKWKSGQGMDMIGWEPKFNKFHISDHLINKGITSFDKFTDHIKEIENHFWTKRFPAYARWKDRWYTDYLKKGYVDLYTGFRCYGPMSKNDATNYPVQGCLQADSKILTQDGNFPIKDLLGKQAKVWTGFSWESAFAVNMGKAQLVEIKLSSGLTVKCDTRHKFKNELNQWVSFSDLKIGSYVALPKLTDEIQASKEMNFDFIFGFIIGDGHVCLRETRKLVNITVGHLKRPILINIQNFLKDHGYNVHYYEIPAKGKKQMKYKLTIEDRGFSLLLESIGITFGTNAHNKRLPKKIWTSSIQNQRDFLEGLWMSDGSRGTSDFRSLHMCNLPLLEDVQVLSAQVGFDSFIARTKYGWKLRFSWNEKNKKPIRKIPHVTIKEALKNAEIKWDWKDNSQITEKRALDSADDISQYVGERILNRFNPTFEIYRYDKITSISVLDKEEDTYTMSVDHSIHQFVADGVITKNSAFHCLLMCFVEIDRIARKEKWNTKLIGQIHDSMILDTDPNEFAHVVKTIQYVTSVWLPKQFPWIIVPVVVEMESCEVDAAWSTKKELKLYAA